MLYPTIQYTLTNFTGLIHGIVSTARAEGITGLYSGLGPTLLAIAPFMAVQQVLWINTYACNKHIYLLG